MTEDVEPIRETTYSCQVAAGFVKWTSRETVDTSMLTIKADGGAILATRDIRPGPGSGGTRRDIEA